MFCKCRTFGKTVTSLCQLGSVTNCVYSSVVLDTNAIILFLYHTLVYSLIVLFSLLLY